MEILKKSLKDIEVAKFLTHSERVVRVREYVESWGSFCVGELSEEEGVIFKEEAKKEADEVIYWLEFPF